MMAFTDKDNGRDLSYNISPTVRCGGKGGGEVHPAIAFTQGNLARGEGPQPQVELTPTLKIDTGDQSVSVVTPQMAVRKLTPLECERLQGMPDNWTRIPWKGKPASECPDGPRYRAIGNSWAVPVLEWIADRLVKVDAISYPAREINLAK